MELLDLDGVLDLGRFGKDKDGVQTARDFLRPRIARHCPDSQRYRFIKGSGHHLNRVFDSRHTGQSNSARRNSIRKAGENTTIWEAASPKMIMSGSDEEKFNHPTQKPAELMRRPILNHTKRGELVYDPFLGSGTTLAAAQLTERVCIGMELDPKYVDVVIMRGQGLTREAATLDGDGRTFDQIKSERAGVAA